MRRAVIITANGFQDEEFTYPYYRLLEAEIEVDVATKGKEVVHGKYGIPAKPTVDAVSLDAADYDAVIIPGGFEAPDRVRQVPEVKRFVKKMFTDGKLVAAICHGPWVAISAGIMKGMQATCFVGMADDLRNAGAKYVDADVVVDGNLITSPHYRNNGDFMKAVVKHIQ